MSPDAVLSQLRLIFSRVAQGLRANDMAGNNEATGFKFAAAIDTWLSKNRHVDLKRIQGSVAVLYTQHIGYAGHVRQPRRYRRDALQMRPVREDGYSLEYDEEEEPDDPEYIPPPSNRRATRGFQEVVDKAVAARMAEFETRMRKEFGRKQASRDTGSVSRPEPEAASTEQVKDIHW